MKNLIKAEWFKLTKSQVFRVLLVINLTASVLLTLLLTQAGMARTGYRAFHLGIAYLFYHIHIGLVFTAVFWCEDFSNKSFGKSLLSGFSRMKIFFAKVIIFWVGMILLFLSFACSAAIASSLLNGFGMDFNVEIFKHILFFAFCGILGCISMSSVMILISTIVKSKIPTIMVIYLLFFPFEYLKNNYRFYENGEDILKFLKYTYVYQINTMYTNQDSMMIHRFQPELFLQVNILTIILSLCIGLIIFEKTEFK